MNAGRPALHLIRKGGEDHWLAIHAQAAERIRVCLEAAGHVNDREGPLFRSVWRSWPVESLRRHLDPDLIDRIVGKYVTEIGLHHGFSAHAAHQALRLASQTVETADRPVLEVDMRKFLEGSSTNNIRQYIQRPRRPNRFPVS
jgi:hypothetical protein